MAAQVAPLEVDESVASLIVAHLPDIRDRLALACVSKVWRSAAGSPGCWGLHHDSLVVEGAVAERLQRGLRRGMKMLSAALGYPSCRIVVRSNLAQLILYVGDELRVLEVHSAALCGLPVARYVPQPGIQQALCFSFLQVLDLRGCKALTVKLEVSYFLACVRIHTRPKENRLDRLMLGGCDLDGLDDASLVRLWTYVRHEPDVNKSLRAPFDLCQCTGCDCIIGKGGQCKGCKHPYCSHCSMEEGEVVLNLCVYCDKEFVCADREGCPGGQPYMSCSLCDLQFCEACSNTAPGCLVCAGSKTREGCLDAICEDCEEGFDEYFVMCDVCDGFWCNRCGTAPEMSYCSNEECSSPLCDDCKKEGPRECCACDEIFCDVCSTYCEKCDDLYCEWCYADLLQHKCTTDD